jgi:hypothetical protein
LFLAFVRTAHYWTKLHPELTFEEDVIRLLASHEALAQCVLNDPALPIEGLSRHLATDLRIFDASRPFHEVLGSTRQHDHPSP